MLSAGERFRVLVVDDNAANRELAVATLEDEASLDVKAVDGGSAALLALQEWLPDCVLLDVRMPGMDGFEVCRRMRALPQGHQVPILFLTAQRDLDTFDAALASGADDFLTKPVRPAELALRVQTALKIRSVRSELREQYDLVRRQRDDLMRLQLQKERMSAFLVHDLKNPISTLDLWAQQALMDPALSPRSGRALRHIREETRTLTRMVLNLLDISRSEEGRLEPKPEKIELADFLENVFDEMTLKAAAQEVQLKSEVLASHVVGDRDLLRRVFVNLVENAVRHSPAESTILVSATSTTKGTRISVSDQGSGIPRELHEQVFRPFVQLESEENNQRTGRGLGLTFCKLAVEAHGGRISIEDGKPGAVFVVWLPTPN
jgi:two-component system, sensor histidine kinase and response regulator